MKDEQSPGLGQRPAQMTRKNKTINKKTVLESREIQLTQNLNNDCTGISEENQPSQSKTRITKKAPKEKADFHNTKTFKED